MAVLTAADVKPHLNMGASTVNNTEIEALIPGVEAAVAQRVGPLLNTAQTVVVGGSGSTVLRLGVYPVTAVTSVTGKSGTVLTVIDDWGWPEGLLHSESSFTEDFYTVVYTAGHGATAGDVPADLKLGVALSVAADWIAMYRRTGDDNGGAAAMFRRTAEMKLAPYLHHGFA